MSGSVVAEKRFIWKFIDQVTQGVKNAKAAMQDAESAAKKVGMEVSGTSTHWKNMGVVRRRLPPKSVSNCKRIKKSLRTTVIVQLVVSKM